MKSMEPLFGRTTLTIAWASLIPIEPYRHNSVPTPILLSPTFPSLKLGSNFMRRPRACLSAGRCLRTGLEHGKSRPAYTTGTEPLSVELKEERTPGLTAAADIPA